MVKLSIVVLNYNTKDLTLKCVESIVKQYRKQLNLGEFETIIVDNASSDNTLEILKKNFNDIKNLFFVKNKENLGFSKGNNLGAKKGKGEYLLFLNSDTEVLDDGLLRMTEYLDKNNQVGILGSRLENPDGSKQKSVGKFYNLNNLILMLLGLERLGFLRESPVKEKKVDWVSGASMMIRTDLFKKIGGFEESLFMYMEDIEICYKAKFNGFFTYFYPKVKVIHKELGSSDKSFAILNIYKGLLFFYKKYKPSWQYNILVFLLKTKAKLAIIVGVLSRNMNLEDTYSKAYKII